MFSRSNHHHDSQRSNSLPPARGSRRPRSPEPTPPESEEEADQHTRSPHTKRIVKKGRTASRTGPDTLDSEPTHTNPSTYAPDTSTPHGPTETPTLTTPLPTPSTHGDAVSEQTRHLETLLDSVLATFVIIQAASTTPVTLSNHANEALSTLYKLTTPLLPSEDRAHAATNATTPALTPELMNPRKQSYADVTKPCQTTSKTKHQARSSPAGATTRHRPSAANQRSSYQHPHSTSRVIASWDGQPVLQSSSSLSQFVRNLNDALKFDHDSAIRGDRRILAANITKSGNVAIHTVNEAIAAALQNRRQMIHAAANAIPDFNRPSYLPMLEVDVPWYGVVIHDLPAASLRDSFDTADAGEDIWALLEGEGGVVRKDIRGKLRILCRDGEEFEKERLSMLVRFEDQRVCDRLCQNGIYLLGSWHRVSRYRERKKRMTPNSSPTPTPPNTT
ncbi:unnamed protein product [Cyclocybe aegerita]|uniref:Uncharacterized protein n=1 Tax=Cyclocybe aegerita TaxID=1973307 RepID=A0A8S0VXR7_CYCAE|nr:unnamed protein product [Cyclocybe aegerita]